MEITLYTESGIPKAELFLQSAELFLLSIIKKTKQIKLKSGEKAFEYIEEDNLCFGTELGFKIFIRKGDFFTIE